MIHGFPQAPLAEASYWRILQAQITAVREDDDYDSAYTKHIHNVKSIGLVISTLICYQVFSGNSYRASAPALSGPHRWRWVYGPRISQGACMLAQTRGY